MEKLLKQFVKYNYWANEKIVSLLVEISPKHLDVSVKSSFTSVRKTVFHIWDAEVLYLKRLQGVSLDSFPSEKFPLTTPIDKMLKTSREFCEFIEDKDKDFFQKMCLYKNTHGEEFSQPFSELILHCMNHSTFHRGQVITILRGLGYSAFPQTDLIHFLRIAWTEK